MTIHLFFSSFLVFSALAIFMEMVFGMFKIKNPRTRAICRTLLILKLPVDFLFYAFPLGNIFPNLNPLSCEKYTAQLFSGFMDSSVVLPFILLISAGIIGVTVTRFCRSLARLKTIYASAEPCPTAVTNLLLREKLIKLKIVILVSDQTQIPFAAGRSKIIFPKKLLNNLAPEEFETIIAHEVEHLRWKDPLLNLVCKMIGSFFWWIPTKWWMHKLEEEQETASDLSLVAYGMDRHHLASAFTKVIAQDKYPQCKIAPLCHLTTASQSIFTRLQTILCDEDSLRRPLTLKGRVGIALTSAALLGFWMC